MTRDPRDDPKNFDPAGMYIGPLVPQEFLDVNRETGKRIPIDELKTKEPRPSN